MQNGRTGVESLRICEPGRKDIMQMRWEELINFTPPCAFSTISAPLPGLRQQCLILPFSLLFIWHASLFFPSFVLYISFCYCKYLLSSQFFFQMYILYSIYLQLQFCILTSSLSVLFFFLFTLHRSLSATVHNCPPHKQMFFYVISAFYSTVFQLPLQLFLLYFFCIIIISHYHMTLFLFLFLLDFLSLSFCLRSFFFFKNSYILAVKFLKN